MARKDHFYHPQVERRGRKDRQKVWCEVETIAPCLPPGFFPFPFSLRFLVHLLFCLSSFLSLLSSLLFLLPSLSPRLPHHHDVLAYHHHHHHHLSMRVPSKILQHWLHVPREGLVCLWLGGNIKTVGMQSLQQARRVPSGQTYTIGLYHSFLWTHVQTRVTGILLQIRSH